MTNNNYTIMSDMESFHAIVSNNVKDLFIAFNVDHIIYYGTMVVLALQGQFASMGFAKTELASLNCGKLNSS